MFIPPIFMNLHSTKRAQESEIMSAEETEAFNRLTPTMPWLYEPILQAVRSFSGKVRSLVDVGCGNGYLLGKIHEEFPEIQLLSGIDIDPRMIEIARKSHPFEFSVDSAHNCLHREDLSISNLALHHFKDPKLAISQTGGRGAIGSIISDQVRPATEEELEERLKRRAWFFRDAPEYYSGDRERASILAAFSREEIINLFAGTLYNVTFVDHDYYERFVAIDDGTLNLASLEAEHLALEALIEEREQLVHAKHAKMKRLKDQCEEHHKDNRNTYCRKEIVEWRMEKHYRDHIDQEALDKAIAIAKSKFGDCIGWFPPLQDVRQVFDFDLLREIVSRPKPFLCLLPLGQCWQPVIVDDEDAARKLMKTWSGSYELTIYTRREGCTPGRPIHFHPLST